MVEGLMIHDQISDVFCYLGFDGYEKIHLHQYNDESKNYKDVSRYYILRKDRLINLGRIDDPGITASMMTGKRQMVRECFKRWVSWEEDTKMLYSKLYTEAMNLCEISDAAKILEYVVDVDKELTKAKQMLDKLETIDFDLVAMYDEQTSVYDQFLHD